MSKDRYTGPETGREYNLAAGDKMTPVRPASRENVFFII